MILVVPTVPQGAASWIQRTSLDGVDFLLAFAWSQRDGHWRLDVLDADQGAIVSGRKLVTGEPLLRGVTDSRRPVGELVVVDTTGVNDLDPGFLDLGARFVLAYADAAAIASPGAGP